MEESLTTESESLVNKSLFTCSRLAARSRTAIFFKLNFAPERAAKSPESSVSNRAT